MSFSEVIMWVMAIGAIIGGIDRIIGNKFGLGEQFEEGFNSMGPLALGMVGIVCLSPVLAQLLGPIVIPALSAVGADPSIFAGLLLPNDTGGYPLAMELAINQEAGLFSGLIVASMMGCTITFSIPVGLSLIEKRDQPYFAQGLLIGLITIPIGSIIGGLIAGYDMSMVLVNSIPVIVIAVLLALGLKFVPSGMVKGCILFGKLVLAVGTIGLVAGSLEAMVGVVIIPNMAPISEGLAIVGSIGVVLLGTFPVLTLLTKALDKPLAALGRKAGMDSTSTAGIIFTLANSVPVYKMMKNMSSRGKIMNTAWLVPATAALGDHLGFTAGVYPEAISAVVISKILAGFLALALSFLLTKNTDKLDRQSEQIAAKESVTANAV